MGERWYKTITPYEHLPVAGRGADVPGPAGARRRDRRVEVAERRRRVGGGRGGRDRKEAAAGRTLLE